MSREAAVALVDRVEKRTRSRMLAYDFVASKIGRSRTWVREFVRNGLGRLDTQIGARIDSLLLDELQAETRRLEHDLELARQCGAHPCSQHVGEIEAHIAKIKALMRGQ